MNLSIVYKLFFHNLNPRLFVKLSLKLFYKSSLGNQANKGIGLLELLSGVLIAGIIIQLAYFGFSVNRQLYLSDATRNDINQDMSSVFDILGPTIIQAGQGIGDDPKFPVISIDKNPTGSTNSQITIKQLKITTKLPLCGTVTAGAPTSITILDTTQTAIAGCDIIDNDGDNYPDNLAQWKNHRNGGTVQVFIYDGTNEPEPLNYSGEKIYDGSTPRVEITTAPTANQVASASITVSGNLLRDYVAGGATQLLIVETRSYRLNNNIFQSSLNGGAWIDLINNIGQFTAVATIQQGDSLFDCTILPPIASANCTPGITISIPSSYNWSQIQSINVAIKPIISQTKTGLSQYRIDEINDLTQNQVFYPRNLINF